MSDNLFGLIELLGVFGLLLGVLGWQWVSIRRTLKRDREAAARDATSALPPPCGEGKGRVGSE